MTELKDIIQEIDDIYGKFTTEDNDPEVESKLKSSLMKHISSLIAITRVKKGEFADTLEKKLELIKNLLISWDPLDNWFKEVKDLVEGVFDLITAAKTLNFENLINDKSSVSLDHFNQVISGIKKEIEDIKAVVASIKQSSLKSMIMKQQELTAPLITSTPPKVTPRPIPKPVPIETPRPVPKPVPIDMPVEIPKPTPKPVPIETPRPVPKPVPIDMPVEIPKPTPKPVPIELPSTKNRQVSRQASKEKLFGLFSQSSEPVQKSISIPKPSTKPKPVPVSFKTIGTPSLKPISKPIENVSKPKPAPTGFKIIGSPVSTSTSPNLAVTSEATDQDKYYQELITLEGKKYSLERNLRDLKSIFDSGSMTESQYKAAYNEKLQELKKISQRIDQIRDKLD
ncbi:MAG: hypothetical protein ACTSVE_11310 [Candidatus Helarchaeota archaeon]